MIEFITNQRLAQLAGVDFNSEEIKQGPIVYSRTHEIVKQFPKLSTFPPCVLITSFSDACVTDAMAAQLPKNVKTWYSNNVETSSINVIPVPLGIRYSSINEQILQAIMNKPQSSHKRLCYANFLIYKGGNVRGNKARYGLYEKFQKHNWITVEGGICHIPMQDYYESMSRHYYIISPPGAGPDCHRHWEALYLGAVPIVLWSSVTSRVLSGFPCVYINTWEELDDALLVSSFSEFTKFTSPIMERLSMGYWRKRITEDAKIL
jgi:hypothetical protein